MCQILDSPRNVCAKVPEKQINFIKSRKICFLKRFIKTKLFNVIPRFAKVDTTSKPSKFYSKIKYFSIHVTHSPKTTKKCKIHFKLMQIEPW